MARAWDIFGALKAASYSQRDDCPKCKDPSLITIHLGGILTVNHPNIRCELTVCAVGHLRATHLEPCPTA